jgi:hypothetical protein
MIPKKPAPGLDPGVETGFRNRSCSNKQHDPEKWEPVFGTDHARTNSMIPKSGNRFSEQIMLEQKARAQP